MSFRDHFSGHAELYGRYRPTYPEALFDWIAAMSTRRNRVWDCATGNGQAAIPLAARFGEVIATDASAEQVAQAPVVPGVRWAVGPSHASGLEGSSVQVVTVAQALHWFDLPPFYAEVRRVLVPRGLLVAWCYEVFHVEPAIDAVVRRLYVDLVGEDWPPERSHIETGYRELEWPWQPVDVPPFEMTAAWDADRTLGYLRTWSATRRFLARTGGDPVAMVEEELRQAWGEGERRVTWPLRVRAGRS